MKPMMRVVWKVRRIDPCIASVRIRTLAPALLLRERGYEVQVTSVMPDPSQITAADCVVINKSYSDADQELCMSAKALGKRVIVDACDDLTDDWRKDELQAFQRQCSFADRLITTGPELAHQLQDIGVQRDRISVIPDIAEDCAMLERILAAFPPTTSRGKRSVRPNGALSLMRWLSGRELRLHPNRKIVVWFGTAGRKGTGVGLESLSLIARALEEVNFEIPLQLVVVTRGYSAFRHNTSQFSFPCIYREWSMLGALDVIAKADVCVIPNPQTKFARAKSPNRCLLALNCGTPVVATSIPSIEEFGDAIVLDDWTGGLFKYLRDGQAGLADVALGRARANSRYGAQTIGDAWNALLRSLSTSH